jgi:hypothetical protein
VPTILFYFGKNKGALGWRAVNLPHVFRTPLLPHVLVVNLTGAILVFLQKAKRRVLFIIIDILLDITLKTRIMAWVDLPKFKDRVEPLQQKKYVPMGTHCEPLILLGRKRTIVSNF